ncbi:ABC transporter permease [Mycolicibacterium diernhoferi]|uniref:ABC transporter permease n=1 Tax=Mycolicibacterium diernhoferi TaxID=1801 RepID=A0A1Q4H467_9MYCO|nr:ABC transporter permease [Mycolicibacterium diernhoferi]OJZ61614.1 ABC transporter permease [Mycolicibacterium diernhoferi]OPE53877.1 ABC transporter permease [Mycolicibacterium diernhoferi]PEG51402.1 ABC transporter permease [Mycolicibacterium diernhoferi]QYL23458.1 ABC transporter permease [Mycolicibacterium diernhoferi]
MNAIAAERIKLTSTRSPLWLALTVVVLSLGLAGIQAVAALPYSTVGPERAGLGVAMFGVPVLMILSALTVTGEYRTSMIRTTFMATPRRSRVLIAKAVVAMSLSGLLAAAMSLGSMVLVRAMLDDRQGAQLALDQSGPWRTVAAITLYAALAALLAVGLGALLRHSAAVIAVLLLLPFVVEPLLGATPGVGSRIGPLFPFANANAFTEIPWLQSFSMWWGPVGSAVYFAAVAATVFAAAVAVTARRDP